MNKFFYPKLAFSNIKKNGKIYVPYILTAILTTALFYMILSLSNNPGLDEMSGGGAMSSILAFGTIITGLFAIIFLFYTNSFLMKRRKKEFGLFNILGMEKRHISKVIFLETFFIALISIVLGILSGMIFSKLAFMALLKMFNDMTTIQFVIIPVHIVITAIFVACIFLLTLLNSIFQIYRSKPIELLHGGQVGEKEPKAKWIITFLGVACLGTGYVLSIITKEPLATLPVFFLAVVLVIIGTYMLFTSGSISVLKMLKKNKKYYYNSNHFVSVSGMMYRMKQNAVGLANICILSTMVLVMISTTFCLYTGASDVLATRYPHEVEITAPYDESISTNIKNVVQNVLHTSGKEVTVAQENIIFSSTGAKADNKINPTKYSSSEKQIVYSIFTQEAYNQQFNKNINLADNEMVVMSDTKDFQGATTLDVMGMPFQIKAYDTEHDVQSIYLSYINAKFVVKDVSVIQNIRNATAAAYAKTEEAKDPSPIKYIYSFDFEASRDDIKALTSKMESQLSEQEIDFSIDSRAASWNDFLAVYGGMFFIGMFLGTLFIMATILIMYYKQMSEGYDDRERFQIMKKVGLSENEVKKTIHSQVISVFFLPLIAATMHLAFAFPIISRLIQLFGITNINLLIYATIGCLLLFTFFYTLVYKLTAKTYYKIVK